MCKKSASLIAKLEIESLGLFLNELDSKLFELEKVSGEKVDKLLQEKNLSSMLELINSISHRGDFIGSIFQFLDEKVNNLKDFLRETDYSEEEINEFSESSQILKLKSLAKVFDKIENTAYDKISEVIKENMEQIVSDLEAFKTEENSDLFEDDSYKTDEVKLQRIVISL